MQLNLDIKQVQTLAITQELVLAIEILQLNNLELSDYIKKEAQENVVLEMPDEKFADDKLEKFLKNYREHQSYRPQNPTDDKEEFGFEQFAVEEESLYDYLNMQLPGLMLKGKDQEIADYIIGNINSKGYLSTSCEDIARCMNLPIEKIEKILKKVQSLEPSGVGGRNLREVLLLQVEKDSLEAKIIENYLEEISKNKLREIAADLGKDVKEIQKAVDKIKELNPKPGSGFASKERTLYITPDAIVTLDGKEINIEIIDDGKDKLKISNYYLDLLESTQDKDVKEYLKDKIKKAMFIVKAIEQRRQTIEKVIRSIVKLQERFFKEDILTPMTLKDVADDIEMSESTISRTTRGKYLVYNEKTYELKDFFTVGLTGKTEDVSSRQVRQRLIEIIEKEDPKKPLSDQKISDILKKEGIEISRRTVAKYRDEENIPSTSKRKRF
ncbi:RNA polymerase factor sigma-54 [Peptoniphilus sp. GNH]|nr:RNA polymerase factor sigma-54 [Peptoniphilus sp. GNH]